MNFDAYARTAVELVNVGLGDLDGLRSLFSEDLVWMRDEVGEKDLGPSIQLDSSNVEPGRASDANPPASRRR